MIAAFIRFFFSDDPLEAMVNGLSAFPGFRTLFFCLLDGVFMGEFGSERVRALLSALSSLLALFASRAVASMLSLRFFSFVFPESVVLPSRPFSGVIGSSGSESVWSGVMVLLLRLRLVFGSR